MTYRTDGATMENGAGRNDRQEIADVVIRFLHAVDRRDWVHVRGSLAARVAVDYTSLFGGKPETMPADALVDQWKSMLPGFDATQHLTGPVVVHFIDESAVAACAVTATHALGTARWVVGGHYELQLDRAAGALRIAGIRLRAAFVDGDKGLPERARDRVRAAAQATIVEP